MGTSALQKPCSARKGLSIPKQVRMHKHGWCSVPESLLAVEGGVQTRHELVLAAQEWAAEAQAQRCGAHREPVAAAWRNRTLFISRLVGVMRSGNFPANLCAC